MVSKREKKEDHASVDEGMLTGEGLGILRLLDQVLGLSRDGSHFGTIEWSRYVRGIERNRKERRREQRNKTKRREELVDCPSFSPPKHRSLISRLTFLFQCFFCA
jgi:hypothetical protein